MGTLVAVYGTLRTGYGNNKYCLARSQSIGHGFVSNMQMYSYGGFPVCCSTDNLADKVVVEVFDTPDVDLAKCDRLEGHPTFYERQEVTVLMENGTTLQAQMYLQPQECCNHLDLVESGDWSKETKRYVM